MSKLIIFPTDTVYGIGCNIFDLPNIKKIYDIKHRSLDKPLACLCANLEQIQSIAHINDKIEGLIQRFLPGALTIIVPAKEEVKAKLGYKTIGVRIPDSSFAIQILLEHGPMLTTSVNDSGMPPINEYEILRKKYASLVDEIYPPCGNSSNLSSTVIAVEGEKIKVLREGSITISMITEVWNA